jgi:3-oxoacyl-[acyl-carrier-protein] synthase-3
MYAKIISTGSYLPEKTIFNHDFTQFPNNAHQLIEEKTGIKSRRQAAKGETTSDLAIKAAEKCLQKIGFESKNIDAIILATSSPDRMQPATATRVQKEIGASSAFAFDINSVCSGGVFGIYLADCMIKSGICRHVLLLASEVYSRFLNQNDFSTFPYFGDGAGAILFTQEESAKIGVLHSVLKTDGSGADLVQIPAGGTRMPFYEVENQKDIFFQMNGKEVYTFAINKGSEVINELLSQSGVEKEDIKLVIPHQANINIIKELSQKTGIGLDKFFVNLDKYGNTAAASILIALDEALSANNINEGDLVITVGFGGGLSWGANLISLTKIKGQVYAEIVESHKNSI